MPVVYIMKCDELWSKVCKLSDIMDKSKLVAFDGTVKLFFFREIGMFLMRC